MREQTKEELYEEAVRQFSALYEEELNKLWPEDGIGSIDKMTYTKIKEKASEIAFKHVPMAKELWDAYVRYRRDQGGRHLSPNDVDDLEVKSGFKLLNARGRVVLSKRKEDREEHGSDIEVKENEKEQDMTAQELYFSYIEEVGIGGFIPKDDVLGHFTGFTGGAFGSARWRARQEGYEFEKHEYGWIVTEVPPEQVDKDEIVDRIRNMSEDEARTIYDLLFG